MDNDHCELVDACEKYFLLEDDTAGNQVQLLADRVGKQTAPPTIWHPHYVAYILGAGSRESNIWYVANSEKRKEAQASVLDDLITPHEAKLPEFTETAVELARSIYADGNWAIMPILADAIQESGCDDSCILNHAQSNLVRHTRGCWLLGLLLKEDYARRTNRCS